jgi:hypothetical protein
MEPAAHLEESVNALRLIAHVSRTNWSLHKVATALLATCAGVVMAPCRK